jgi:hypothetical protein
VVFILQQYKQVCGISLHFGCILDVRIGSLAV